MRLAVITGGGKGIGAAVAKRLRGDGFDVILGYNRSQRAANELAAELGGTAIPVDVTDSDSVAAFYAQCRKIGKVDTLVNNAGVALYKLFQDVTDDEYSAVMDCNCGGAFKITRAFLPDMISNGFGRIVNIASMWGVVGAAMETVYSMSKAAVIGLTKALAKEVGSAGVTVNAVAPGAMNTDMLADFTPQELADIVDRTPVGRIGTPDDVAAAVSYLVARDSFVTGEVLNVNGGLVI